MADLMEQAKRVPVQTGGQANWRIREAMQLFEREPAAVEGTENRAPAFSSEVDGEEARTHSTTFAEIWRKIALRRSRIHRDWQLTIKVCSWPSSLLLLWATGCPHAGPPTIPNHST